MKAVEVDRVVVGLAKKYFGLLEDSDMQVRVDDAYAFVARRAEEIALERGAKEGETEENESGEMNEFGENSENAENGKNGEIGGSDGNDGIRNNNPAIPRRGKQGVIGGECVDGCELDKPTLSIRGGGKKSPSLSLSSECETDSESNSRSSPRNTSGSGSESEGECRRMAKRQKGKGVDGVGRMGVCTDTCFTNDGVNRDIQDLLEDSKRYFCVILDVDVNDGKLGLSSPPPQFLSIIFLSKVKEIVRGDGIFAINVVPLAENAYTDACRNLKKVFCELWEIRVDGDANRILFALPEGSGDRKALSLAGAKFAQSDGLLESIRKL